jgi:hypothetical protein
MEAQSYFVRAVQLGVRIVLNLYLVDCVSDLVVSFWLVHNFIFGIKQNGGGTPAAHLQIDDVCNSSFPHGVFHHQFEAMVLLGIETLNAVSVVIILAKVGLGITLGSFS